MNTTTKPHVNNMTSEHVAQLANLIAQVASLTPSLHGMTHSLAKKARAGEFDAPATYAALGNAMLTVADAMSRIDEITDQYESDLDAVPLVDGSGKKLDGIIGQAGLDALGVAGAIAYLVDRTFIPVLAVQALNEVSIALHEELPFPDDASPEQLERAAGNLTHAAETAEKFASVMQAAMSTQH